MDTNNVDDMLGRAALAEMKFLASGVDLQKRQANLYFKKAMQADGDKDFKGPVLN